ncbi:carbon starvation protein A [Roseiconus lacunae]|uniref:Carbon starvation protein A n=1 Tax=Roseiconus lacunae TaxID=2605694 RepID=A0ABT7PNM7_9BACT|nr:carbon starvation protein A [Roseiconus lacunae]MCD0460384.1 carbon starvation protein A [Roseiconus lacunae]MDM4018119.1 carbon starvation protein A [Roseiconus lacunae]WRQ51025.1 carbon starvation protein A [Stieleria sp. HD01]
MSTLVVAVLSMVGFVVAYNTYGKWLAKRLFALTDDAVMPSTECRDDVDFVPTRKSIVFGHHFTSIAGTGPIVGPALAVFWGWLPALLWVIFGSILIGGVHDLAALVISIRNRGQTIGQAAGRLISTRAKVLFLIVLALALSVVLAVFGLVIANIFKLYPESVLSVWIAMPIAVVIGLRYRQGGGLVIPSLVGLALLYVAVYVGAYWLPLDIAGWLPQEGSYMTPVVVWTVALLAYAFIASVLPVWLLLQPRDYINSLQLFVALALLVGGLAVASLTGQANLSESAPAIAQEVPADAPSMFPFLFITIACGACSGFHCLVSSGTTSKQLEKATDAQAVGYGSMLLEGMLAVLVILACSAGVGMGTLTRSVVTAETATADAPVGTVQIVRGETKGQQAWRDYYRTGVNGEKDAGWGKQSLARKLRAFIDGGGNFLSTLGIPLRMAIATMAVLVACFAATTLDTATRLQRYVLSELALSANAKPLANKYVATAIAVGIGLAIAVFAGDTPGEGGLMLWPLFGATNQLLAGLALMVAVVYLARRSKPVAVVMFPMIMMLLMPAWAITSDLYYRWLPEGKWVLSIFGISIMVLQIWMVIEGILILRRCRGVIEPPIEVSVPQATA